MKRLALALVGAALVATWTAGAASSAQPNNRACLGTDFSTYARYGAPGPVLTFDAGSGFGQFNAWLAQRVPGLGLPIQVHLAGYISDFYVLNSCND